MRRLASICFLTLAATVFLFAACDSEPAAEEEPTATPSVEVKTDDLELKANEDTISVKTPEVEISN